MCVEFHTAVRSKKKIIVIKDFNYEFPNPLPGEWAQYAHIIHSPIVFVYDPIYLDSISIKLFKEISQVIQSTDFETLKKLNLINVDALSGIDFSFFLLKILGKFFKYTGTWEGSTLFRFDLYLTENSKFTHLNTETTKYVSGNMAWTLLVLHSKYLSQLILLRIANKTIG